MFFASLIHTVSSRLYLGGKVPPANPRRYPMKKRNWLKTLLAVTLVCTSVVFADGGAAVKGNPKSKVYHKPACQHYNAKGSTVEFKSEAAAKQAGYKSCKQCSKAKAADKGTKKK